MQANITAVSLPEGRVPDLTREPRASPEPASPLDVRAVPREALRVALKLAQGDTSRLRFLPDGTVMVDNRPRPARRVRESKR